MRVLSAVVGVIMIGSCRAFAFGRGGHMCRRMMARSSQATVKASERPCYCHSFTRSSLYSTENDNSDSSNVEPSWTYVPYQPPPAHQRKQQRRNFSSGSWSVPKHVSIPQDDVDITFNRSSGAGGQNVNKLNTKADLKIHVMNASWLPLEVRQRLSEQQANRINKEGYLTLSSQEYRTQAQNKKSVLGKLQEMILQAYPRPKKRNMRKGLSKATKERRKEEKRKRSQVKANRRNVDF